MHKHIYIKNGNKTMILLHGTGGDEKDLIPLAKYINSDVSLLSFRGKVVENGHNRFFKRVSPGIYDLDSFKKETKDLKESIIKYTNEYKIKLDDCTIVGFSNGANIAQGLIKEYPELIKNYILLSPDYIEPDTIFKDLKDYNIFISTSKDDPMIDYNNVINLIKDLRKGGANLKLAKTYGHQVIKEVIDEAIIWFKEVNNIV